MKKLMMILSIAIFCGIFASSAFAYEDITPADAYDLATSNPDVFIVDVRTDEEWTWVGHPGANALGEGAELDGKVVSVEHKKVNRNGELVINRRFVKEIDCLFDEDPNVILIMMCRSGGRSIEAALRLEEAGYTNIMNMVTGFEGSKDIYGYRTVNGWRNDGLPYQY